MCAPDVRIGTCMKLTLQWVLRDLLFLLTFQVAKWSQNIIWELTCSQDACLNFLVLVSHSMPICLLFTHCVHKCLQTTSACFPCLEALLLLCYGKSPHFPSLVMVRFHSDVVLKCFKFSLLKENIYLFIISCEVKVLLFTEINDLFSMQFFFPKPEENHF